MLDRPSATETERRGGRAPKQASIDAYERTSIDAHDHTSTDASDQTRTDAHVTWSEAERRHYHALTTTSVTAVDREATSRWGASAR